MKIELIGSITMLLLAMGCESEPVPLSKPIASPSRWWVQSNTLEEIWPYLEEEEVQKFGLASRSSIVNPPEYGFEVTEPEKIKVIMDLLLNAMKEEEERWFESLGQDEENSTRIELEKILSVLLGNEQMIIITDQHKYIIPIGRNSRSEEIRGIGWTSWKLRKKLTDWGFAKPVSEGEDRRLECVWENFEEENIQRINFCQYVLENKVDPRGRSCPSLECRPCGEINEPQKINKVLKILRDALKRRENRIEEGKTYKKARMKVVTDKHKYNIRIFIDEEAVYGIGWTSYELRRQLRKWGFSEPK